VVPPALASVALAIACGGTTSNDLFATPQEDDDDFVVPVGNTSATGSSVGGATSTGSTVSTTLTTTEGGPTSATVTSTTGGGTGNTPCDQLTEWESENYEQMFPAGTEFTFQGRRYQANEDITYTNPQCEPNAPADWCASWSTDVGPC